MADPNAPLTLADILLADAMLGNPNPDRPWAPQVGRGGHGMPYLPPMVPNRLGGPELRSGTGAAPEVDAFMEATGLPLRYGPALDMAYWVGSAGPRQVQKAERAIEKFAESPSVGSAANVGTHGGMALMRPAIALPSLAVQYGDALARDLGVFDTSAQAQQAKKGAASKVALPGLSEQQQLMYDAADRRIREQNYSSAAERRQLEQTMQELRALSNNIQLKGAESRQGVEADAARKEREEYDRAVKRAEDVRAMEEGKRKTFRDTAVGKVWEETGGAAPFLAGVASGAIQRGINPAVSHSKVLGFGALGGAGASNVPLGADAYLVPPVENPDKRAAEAYARELPPNHPRKSEWLDYAASPRLPTYNPARSEAQREFWDTWPAIKRNLFGAAEGAFGSEMGYGAVHIPGRAVSALGRFLRGLTGPRTPAATSGGAAGDIPSVNAPASASTADRALAGPTPPASLVATPGQPQGRLPAPESAPNQSGGPSLSSILKQLDVANSNRAHHSKYQPRGQKQNSGQFKQGKPQYPDDEK